MRGTIDSTRARAPIRRFPVARATRLDALEQAGRTFELAQALQRETEIALQLEPLGVAVVEERGRPLEQVRRGCMVECQKRALAGATEPGCRVAASAMRSVPETVERSALQMGADQLIAFAARVEPSGEALVHPGAPHGRSLRTPPGG